MLNNSRFATAAWDNHAAAGAATIPAARWFRFRFGQQVRVRAPHPDRGATGWVLDGQLYPDGRETYSLDIPGGYGRYESHELEEIKSKGV